VLRAASDAAEARYDCHGRGGEIDRQALQKLCRAEQPDPRSGQLNRERDTVKKDAYPRDSRHIPSVEGEVWCNVCGPLYE
jgi:hypothetical protein